MAGERTGRTIARYSRTMALCAALGLSLSGCYLIGSKTPHTDAELWVNPETPAAQQVLQWRQQGRDGDAVALQWLADQPIAEWIGDAPGIRARHITESAARAGKTPVLVAYHIPYRDCGSHSAGGAAGADGYRKWVKEFASGIEGRKAIVVLEPDAVAQAVEGCVPEGLRAERLGLLKEAVVTLSALPATRVYLDAGHSGWVKDRARLAEALRLSGVAQADGFALNVSNFQSTRISMTYGDQLSEALGGAHYLVDTSRNGNGPVDPETRAVDRASEREWCNPPGRKLGERPTTRTGFEKADAFLWIKRPGESDGPCNGGPPAGQWWAQYALGLAQSAGG
ncbi:glycoside hydrolase family 6 protein [Streptomyces sp. H27-D2]|uniref:glycoside hydrolase family 6 protein n=1 Tax=Streptomyces sp. H27-D2 TaxID=3046304 RepID=UPI002DB9008A|nr:glycoside hydrolase family 6 protein [Streptomyces sp. H27-D2]MEC4019157.1 glycoside hydrolase family 6 protein [Streptomyces sp. H27-D2]